MERSLVLIKPDGVQRGLIGEIITRLEKKGLIIAGAKLIHMSSDLAERHYSEHKGKPFFKDLVDFITSGPVLAMVWEGKSAVTAVRTIMGATNPLYSMPGTIRGDYGLDIEKNIMHSSDSPESASQEISLFFSAGEILTYPKSGQEWI